MRHHRLIDSVLRVLPFDAWKDALIRGHVERCPTCGRNLASADEARPALVGDAGAEDTDRLKWEIARKIAKIEPASAPAPARERSASASGRAWRWAAALSGLLAAAVATVGLVLFFRPAPPSAVPDISEADQIQIRYVKIADEPAQTLIFKPHDSAVVIVWAGKTH